MDGLVWCLLVLLSYKYILTGISLLIGIVFFSVSSRSRWESHTSAKPWSGDLRRT